MTINRYESNKLKHRILRLPTWAVDLLRAGRERQPASTLVFPSIRSRGSGKLRDPSNTSADLRDSLEVVGVEGITNHVFRKAVRR